MATLAMDVSEESGLVPGYSLKLNSLRSRASTSSSPTRSSASASSTPRCVRRRDAAARSRVLRRREHPHARRARPTRSRSTSASSPTRRGSASRTPSAALGLKYLAALQRHGGRRRLRAGAGVRRDRARRRRQLGGVSLPEVAAARRAARHRRAHAPRRQAQGPPRPRRHVLHDRRRHARASAPSSGGWSTSSCRGQQVRRSASPSAREAERSRQADRRKASTLDAARARDRGRRRLSTTATSTWRSTRRARTATLTVRAPDGSRAASRPDAIRALGRSPWCVAARVPRARRRLLQLRFERARSGSSRSRPTGDARGRARRRSMRSLGAPRRLASCARSCSA